MKQKTIIALLALVVVGIVAAAGASAFGFGFGQDQEARDVIRDAIDNNDFDAWKSAVSTALTEENFNQLVEIHQNMGQNRAQFRKQGDEMRDAIEAGDYDAYLEALGNMDTLPPGLETLTEEDFDLLVQIHEARQDGDYETAEELSDELGFDCPMAGGFGRGPGMHAGGFSGRGSGRGKFNMGE
ncbi:hypothetical protein JXC34_04075 [Candidatus Woesearchaeota archaeon]|nr:hypothetical protein [Candidatus Woesearchaeota archaeon]